MQQKTHSGYIAIIGRPNVGKSTLLNRILGQKISITSKKPQTTRQKILGIKTLDNFQMIYVDTPGIHKKEHKLLNRYMNRAAISSAKEVDAIVFVVDGTHWSEDDELVFKKISKLTCPVILAINKVDKISQKDVLLAYIQNISQRRKFAAIFPISAESGMNVSGLEKTLQELLPEGPFYFSPEQLTDRDNRFLAAEIIREKLIRFLGEELPYSLTVLLEQLEDTEKILRISATIVVERAGQKVIIIGKNGEMLKKIGTTARKEMEALFARKVFLQLWVKVKSNWADDARKLQSLGFGEK